MVVDNAIFYYHLYMTQNRKILQRIALGHDHICTFADLNRTCDITNPGKCRIQKCSGIKSKGIGYPTIFSIKIQFSPHIILGHKRASRVRTKSHRNPLCQIFFCHFNDTVKDDLTICLLFLGRMRYLAIKKTIWQSRTKCCHLKSTVFFK